MICDFTQPYTGIVGVRIAMRMDHPRSFDCNVLEDEPLYGNVLFVSTPDGGYAEMLNEKSQFASTEGGRLAKLLYESVPELYVIQGGKQ